MAAQVASIEELQQKLQDQIEALAKQRKEEADQYQRELAERNRLVELERQEQIRKHEEAERVHRERRAKEMEAAQAKQREADRVKTEAEQAQSVALAVQQSLAAKLQWLNKEIAKQEFIEEQHRKHIADLKATVVVSSVEGTVEINVEHPVAPVSSVDPGGAVDQTDGIETGPAMSQHLRHILRQAQRP